MTYPRGRLLLFVLLASTCAGATDVPQQSAMDPAAPAAHDIAGIGWLLIGGGTVIFAGVLALLLYGLVARTPRRPVGARLFIVGGGVVFPAVVLTALLIYTVIVGARLTTPAPADALTVDVTGHMWWWDVRYNGPGDTPVLTTANELRIPVGRPVRLRLHAADVIHSFWVPNLSGKIDMIPGRVNRLTLQADKPGVYRGQCAEFCGRQHTRMALHVVAEPADVWERWFAQRGQDVPAPVTAERISGRRVFMDAGCGACHAVRGVSAPPPGLAPDLTHIGSRPSLAAGLLPNTRGHLVAWIASAQTLKPGSGMPSFHHLDGASLNALAAYLSSLE